METSLRPLKPALPIPPVPEPFPWLLCAASLLGLVLLGVLGVWLTRYIKKKNKPSAYQKTCAQLHALLDSNLAGNQTLLKIRPLFIDYLFVTRGLQATGLTSEAFFTLVDSSPSLKKNSEELKTLWKSCDDLIYQPTSPHQENLHALFTCAQHTLDALHESHQNT